MTPTERISYRAQGAEAYAEYRRKKENGEDVSSPQCPYEEGTEKANSWWDGLTDQSCN